MGHMTTTQHHDNLRAGSRAAIDAWTARADAVITAAESVPFVTFPRDTSAGVCRHGR